jgi:GT2 family glycosyltransferase
MGYPTVAIVILNWNGRKWLEKFLPSVMATSYPEKRVIVADNGSSDDSISFLQRHYPTLQILQNDENEGFAKGYNSALQQVSADYYVLLNSDVEVTPGWIEPVITLMEQEKDIGACQPKLLDYHNKNLFEYAGAAGGMIDSLGYPFARGRVFGHCEADTGQFNENKEIFWASGAALFVRAELYHRLNGLDPAFFAHQEELDFCWRLQLAGFRVFYCAASVVYHVGGGTLKKENPNKTYLNFRNNLMMLEKNLPKKGRLLFMWKRLVLNDIAALQFLLTGHYLNFWAVHRAKFFYIKRKLQKKFVHTSGALPLKQLKGVVSRSIVYNYFVKKKKTYGEIADL